MATRRDRQPESGTRSAAGRPVGVPVGADVPKRIAEAALRSDGTLTLRCASARRRGASGPGSCHDVSCLRALHPETLAGAAGHLGDDGLLVLLHGDCCASISIALQQARALLTGAGTHVRLELRSASAGPTRRPDRARDGAGFSRRDLLRSLRRDPPAQSPHPPAGMGNPPSVPAVSGPRGVLLAALPSAPVPIPEAGPGCTGCRVCERLCPTDALEWREGRDGGRLTVTPADCITCGLCVRSCPEDVLALTATAPANGPAERVASITTSRCDRCGAAQNPHDQRLCTACRSRESLLEDVLAQVDGG